MATNKKTTTPTTASLAGATLADSAASKLQRKLAAGVLSQAVPGRETGAELERVAGQALGNDRSAEVTRQLAASLVSQSNRKR